RVGPKQRGNPEELPRPLTWRRVESPMPLLPRRLGYLSLKLPDRFLQSTTRIGERLRFSQAGLIMVQRLD
ncbi:MAG: hypothetical protein MK364_08985, partial [Pirellulales bacterium]|nr:hypothetical protein [Pirellulales bacterium]